MQSTLLEEADSNIWTLKSSPSGCSLKEAVLCSIVGRQIALAQDSQGWELEFNKELNRAFPRITWELCNIMRPEAPVMPAIVWRVWGGCRWGLGGIRITNSELLKYATPTPHRPLTLLQSNLIKPDCYDNCLDRHDNCSHRRRRKSFHVTRQPSKKQRWDLRV